MNNNGKAMNFGSIGGRSLISFIDPEKENHWVVPAKFRRVDEDSVSVENLITEHEAFVRWKIARKAWQTRKNNSSQLKFL